MLRLKSNCNVMSVPPWVLDELMLVRPGMAANCFSSGSATDDAIVSGLAPGNDADTRMVGKSTLGRSATGSSWYESVPNTSRPRMSSVVVWGRATKTDDRFMGPSDIGSRVSVGPYLPLSHPSQQL